MELCERHWDALRSSLKLHGVWELQIHEKAQIEQFQRVLNGEPREGDDKTLFDSVVAGQMLVFQQALDFGGLQVIFDAGQADEDEFCPLCEAEKLGKKDTGEWITAACSEIRAEAVKAGRLKETMQ